MAVSMGRLRPDTQYDYKFVCLSHNTLRGAAGGAVLLAELLCAEGYQGHLIRRRLEPPIFFRTCFRREPVFTGACTAIVTPFDQSGAINYDRFGSLIDEQIARGVDAICVCGTTGECATLSIREHIAAVEYCVKRVNHRVKVIAGAGSNDTSAAVYLSQHAQDSGADALLLVTPYYNKASQTGLIQHYTYIADRVELPIILYNVPSRTGVSFTAETYQVLSQHPNINGVKEASGNFSLLSHTRALCGDDFHIWSGNDDQVVPMMSLGAKGVISVAANIVPEVMVQMSHLCLEGRFREAAALQIEYTDLIDALFLEVNPIPIKTALNLAGYEVGSLRLPLCAMSDGHLETLRRAMESAQTCSNSAEKGCELWFNCSSPAVTAGWAMR